MWYCNCGYTFRGIVEIYSQLISFDSPQLLKLGIYFMLLSLVSTRTRYQTRSDQIWNADCRPFPLILNKYGSMFLNIIFTKNDRRITSSISLSNTQSQHPKSCKWVLIIVEVIENRNIWFRHFPPSFKPFLQEIRINLNLRAEKTELCMNISLFPIEKCW